MKANRLEIFGITEFETSEGTRSSWTKVGVAFRNQDESLNLIFDYFPANLSVTTLQVRETHAKEGTASKRTSSN